MSNADWRSQLANFVDGTDSNLRTLRKDVMPQQPSNPSVPIGGRAPSRQPEAVANARAELSTLLAAVQGSLADLRVEVAAAKRLSTNAAAVAGDMSPAAKGPAVRSSSAHGRLRESRPPQELTPPAQLRMAPVAAPYALGQPFGPLIVSPPVSPPAMIAASTPASSNGPHNEELVKAIDQRLLELGHKIERSLERSMEEQTLRSQIQQAVHAAAAMQQQQVVLRSSVPSPPYSGLGTLAAGGALVSVVPDGNVAAAGAGGVGANGATGGNASSPAGTSSLAVLAMNKADAAEKLSTEVRSELLLLQKQAGKESEDTEKRLTGLQDASRQQWEKLCQVSSQVDSLLAQRTGTAELQAEVARISAKLLQLDGSQDRTVASLEEQQRLMRQLTATVQKLTQDAESEHAIHASRNGEIAAKLDAAAARAGELEARVSRVGDVGARLERLGDVEMKLGRLGELESRVARIADLEARVGRLPDVEARVSRLGDLEVKVARMGDMEAKMARLGDVESKLSRLVDVEARLGRLNEIEGRLARLGDVESRYARLGDMEAKLARLNDVEGRLARLGDVEGKLARLPEMEARLSRLGDVESRLARLAEVEARLARLSDVEPKLARLGDLESRLARHDDVEAKLARLGDVEAKLARLHDVEARVAHMGELDARVAALQASVAAVSAAARSAPTPAVVASPRSEPDPSVPEALRRLAALEHQVARLAAAEQSSMVQDRRRGQPQLPQCAGPSNDSMRSEGLPLGLNNLCVESSGSPLSSAHGGNSRRRADDRPLTTKDLDDRIRVLEDAILQSSSYGSPGPNRSVQALTARMERLEQIVRSDSSIESMAQEARLAVTEEFVLELRRDFHDVVGPTLEKLAAHVSELRKGQGQGNPETAKMAAELRQLSNRLDAVVTEVTSLAQAAASSASTAAAASGTTAQRRLSEQSDSVTSATQERLLVLEAQVKELGSAVEDTSSIFPRLQRHQGLLDRLQIEVEGLRSGIAAQVAELKARADVGDEAFVQVQAATDEAREQLTALARLDEQLEGVAAAVQDLSERLCEQGKKLTELERQQLEQQEAVAAASAAAAELAATAAAAAAVAGAGAGVVSRSLDGGASGVQAEAETASSGRAADEDAVDKAALEEVANELRGKLADLRNSIGDMRKELGSKVQTLDAQTRELLAFREEISSSFVEMQDDVERLTGLADNAVRATSEHDAKLQELTQQLEAQAEKAATAAAATVAAQSTDAGAAQAIDPAALEEMKATLNGLQQRVSSSASEQHGRLEALDAKVQALSELITAASQDSQAGVEARSRAEELAYELAQAQEALDSLAVDSGRLAEQLAAVAAAGGKTAEQLEGVTKDVQEHDSALKELQGGLQRLEDKVTAMAVASSAPSGSVAARLLQQVPQAQDSTDWDKSDMSLPGDSVTHAPRLTGALPTSRSSLPGSQAILNPLYSASSDDFFANVAPPAGTPGPAQQPTPSQLSASSQNAFSSPGGSGLSRLRNVDPLPPMPPRLSEEASVRDKAQYYEKLASKQSGESIGSAGRRLLSSPNSGALGGPEGQGTISEPTSPRPSGINVTLSQGDGELASPSAAAAVAARAVGIAGLRHAAQAAGGSGHTSPRVNPEVDPASSAQEPVVATGALAAVRAARSGLGLSGDLSSSLALSPRGGQGDGGDGDGGVTDSPAAATPQHVFGREQTFRRGGADEEVQVSSDEGEADGEVQGEDAEGDGRKLGREQTFRRGGADEEVSVSSGDGSDAEGEAGEDGGEVLGQLPLQDNEPDATLPEPPEADDPQDGGGAAVGARSDDGDDDVFGADDEAARGVSGGLDFGERSGEENAGSGFDDDDDDLELAGLAQPAPPSPPAAAAPRSSSSTDNGDDADAADSAPVPVMDAKPDAAASVTVDQPPLEDQSGDLPPVAAPYADPAAKVEAAEGDADEKSDDNRSPSESVDIDEDIELEPGINPSGFDYDDEDEGVWPGSVSLPSQTSLPQTASGGPPAANKTPPQPAVPAAPASTTAAPTSPQPTTAPATAAPAAKEADSGLSTSGALAGGPQLAPLQLSGSAAAMLSGDSLGRRKLPPLGALPLGSGAAPLAPTSPLTASRGLDLPPPLHRSPLGPLQHSGNLSGHLSGELQGLAPPQGRQASVDAGGCHSPVGAPSASGAPEGHQSMSASSHLVAKSLEDFTASLGTSTDLLGRKLLSPLSPLSPLVPLQRAPAAGGLAPLKPPPGVAPIQAAATSPSRAKPEPLASGPHDVSSNIGGDVQDSLTASGFSDMSIGDLHSLGPDRRRGEAVAESAADPVAPELLAPAPLALPPRPPMRPGAAPTSPLRSLLLAPQIHPFDMSGADDDPTRPGLPMADPSTASGSLPRSELILPDEFGALSAGPSSRGLSREPSAPNPHADPMRPVGVAAAGPAPLPATQSLSKVVVASLLETASDFGGVSGGISQPGHEDAPFPVDTDKESDKEPSGQHAKDAGAVSQSSLDNESSSEPLAHSTDLENQPADAAPLAVPAVDTAAELTTRPSASQASTPVVSPMQSPNAKHDRSKFVRKTQSPGAVPPPRLVPASSVDAVVAAAGLTEEADHDADVNDTATSSAALGTTALGAPKTASSVQGSEAEPKPSEGDSFGDDNDYSMDLELPGMGGTTASKDTVSAAAAAGPSAPAGTLGRASGLPPLHPGTRSNVAAAPSTAAPSGHEAATSRRSMFTSEDSLALVAPEEGADDGILGAGSEEDIFAESADVEAMGGVSLDIGSESLAGGLRTSRSVFSAGDDSQTLAQQDEPQAESSNGSLDFNGDVCMEAERIATMLSVRRSNSSGNAASASNNAQDDTPFPANEQSTQEEPSGLLEDDGPSHAPTGPAAAGTEAGNSGLIQGSLDFYDEDDDGATSSSGSSAAGTNTAAAAGSEGAEGGLQRPSGKGLAFSSDSSMELEMFRPPAAQQKQQPEVEREASAGGSGDGSAGGTSAAQQKGPRETVIAVPFGQSLGDMSTSSGAYRLLVVTGDKAGAGCGTGEVRITMYGSEGTVDAQLRPPEEKRVDGDAEFFTPGAVDEFMVDTTNDLGDLSAVYIWHQGEGFSASWYVESITVEQLMTGLEWAFEVHDWVRGGQRGGRVVRLPGAQQLSISRENSLARLAGTQPTSPLARTSPGPLPGTAGASRPPRLEPMGTAPGASGAPGLPQRRGISALGDESMDVSSDLNSPVEGTSGHGHAFVAGARTGGFGAAALPPMPLGRPYSTLEAVYRPVGTSRLSGERSAGTGTGTHSESVHFSEDDDGEDLLPGMGGSGRTSGDIPAGLGASAFAGPGGAAAAAAAGGAGGVGRMASNVPSGLGLVLEEDIEEVDGMLSSAAYSLGPVSTTRSGPALVSPRPPLPPGAPRRRDPFDEVDSTGADAPTGTRRQQALPPTPPMNRRSSNSGGGGGGSRRQSFTGLEAEGSLDSVGSGTGGGRRRVRISGGDDDDLASEASVEGSELSATSIASLCMYAPSGIRPPALDGGSYAVEFMGTGRKRVSWAEYAEEYEFAREGSSGSVQSMTEEDLLEAQGETVRPDASRVGYDDLIRSAHTIAGRAAAAASPGPSGTEQPAGSSQAEGGGDGTGFMEVPLKRRHGQHANSYGYKIKVFTADRMNAGLGGSTVHVELLGRDATVAQELPKGRGSFQRGCVDRFTLYSHAGDMGQLLALKVWHEGRTLGLGNWGFEQVVIDDRLKGTRYVFRNPNTDCVLRKGRRHCLVMKPAVSRIDESEDLAEVAREYETQLVANRDLSEVERDGLRGKLEKINQRLSKLGSRLAQSMSDSFGWK
ncbi:hypothetical protein Agub_g9288 [Astrephomene gubernaculifera]|uniref:PLAT domain-containing protein n=1 Tax=Astrephomene gubernaculifera TaxID=47775 RepID=A0AAD3DTF4_9CHLO|nr:hypothetical protein Agub_g9288 [Astrephomene gubernaculifera]